jgi:2,4-dienoyl-CoA reductase-like NADH-dependent reductase (Old Yellow Enzyme family)
VGTAVVPDGRATENQLVLAGENEEAFRHLLEQTLRTGREALGVSHRPLCIIQLQDVGRQRKVPGARPAVVTRNPYLNTPRDVPLMTDSEVEALEDRFVEAGLRALRIGFDGVDIKASNGYLGCDFLAARDRPGRYGGSFENRTRFLLHVVGRIREEAGPAAFVTVRLNLYDGIPFPYSWGTDRTDPSLPDPAEPIPRCRTRPNRSVSAGSFRSAESA